MKRLLLFAFLCCAALVSATTLVPLAPAEVYPEIAQRVVRQLSREHLSGERFGDRLSAVAWENLMNGVDPDRTLLTLEDLKRYEPMKDQIDDMLREGDLSFGYDVMHLIRERVMMRCDLIEELLAKPNPFDFTVDESYEWSRRKATRPANAEEQKKLWTASLKNEYLALMLSQELDAEEKAKAAEDPKPKTEGSEEEEDSLLEEEMSLPPAEVIAKRYRTLRSAYREMDSETVLQRYLSAVATAYDPHTDYMSPLNFEDFSMEMNLTLCGIGATLRYDDGMVRVEDLMPGAPAANDTRDIRLRKGDKIIGVGQGDEPIEDVMHKPLSRTVRKIRGPKGTKVVLKVIPASDKSGARTKIVDLIRDEIKLEEQAVTGHVEIFKAPDGEESRLGYVEIPAFYAGVIGGDHGSGAASMTRDLLKFIRQFNSEHVDGLVIDLRNNGGGSLMEALMMTGLFVHGPVVQVRDSRSVQVLPSRGAVAFRKPIVVLINRNSASASEIVASALQDYGRAILVGDSKTHGKGTVQTVEGLGGDNAVYGADRVTTACFYRINGGTTQLRGVEPDIVIPSIYDALELGEDQLPGALPYSTVRRAYYMQTGDVQPFLPYLRKRSDERLKSDDQYTASQQLIDHIRAANADKRVPLQIDRRRERMRAERAVEKLQDEALKTPRQKKKAFSLENDPVLREAFAILADYINLRGGPSEPVNTEGDMSTQFYHIFGAK